MFQIENAENVSINRDRLKILITEDDNLQALGLEYEIKRVLDKSQTEYEITHADSKNSANRILNTNYFDIAFFDLNLDGDSLTQEGLELLQTFESKIAYPVILSSMDDSVTLRKGKKAGCRDFLSKPFKPESIDYLYKRYKTITNQEDDYNFIFSKYITKNPETIKELQKITSLRNNQNVIYINGATGTGKQVVAEIIYNLISNRKGNFIEENCASIPKGLEESTLFGHKKGAFTDAKNDRKGLFELANNGVLFLDEIGKLSYETQGKLLKVIEQKKFRPVGSDKELTFNGIIITASCENLKSMIKEGTFRNDLFGRISGIEINLKPLKERKEDVMLLLNHFIKTHKSGRRIEISKDAKEFLTNYEWPENVREIVKEVEKWHSQGIIELTKENIHYLNQKQIEVNYNYLNANIIQAVEEYGLDKIIHSLSEEIIEYFHKKNGNKVRKTVKELKSSNRQFYKFIKKDGGKQ